MYEQNRHHPHYMNTVHVSLCRRCKQAAYPANVADLAAESEISNVLPFAMPNKHRRFVADPEHL